MCIRDRLLRLNSFDNGTPESEWIVMCFRAAINFMKQFCVCRKSWKMQKILLLPVRFRSKNFCVSSTSRYTKRFEKLKQKDKAFFSCFSDTNSFFALKKCMTMIFFRVRQNFQHTVLSQDDESTFYQVLIIVALSSVFKFVIYTFH